MFPVTYKIITCISLKYNLDHKWCRKMLKNRTFIINRIKIKNIII